MITKSYKMIPQVRRPTGCARAVSLLVLLASPVLANFGGSDSLARKSPNWAELFSGSDRDRLVFRNSQLEYSRQTSTDQESWSYLKWTPNQGSFDRDWYVQVYVHRREKVSIGVVDSTNRKKGYLVSATKGSDYAYQGRDYERAGFSASTLNQKEYQSSANSATDGLLRIHFDSRKKTLTGSWKTRLDWHYFPSFKIDPWGMGDSSTFTAVLVGGGYSYDRFPYPTYSVMDSNSTFGNSRRAYFRHFECGPAAPEMNVEQPEFSDLADGISKRRFGAAVVGHTGITRKFTIRNNGTARLAKLKITIGGSSARDFIVGKPGKRQLTPGESTTFEVMFKPKAAGTRRARLHIASNHAAASPFDITLTGIGVY